VNLRYKCIDKCKLGKLAFFRAQLALPNRELYQRKTISREVSQPNGEDDDEIPCIIPSASLFYFVNFFQHSMFGLGKALSL
jgi:hypothetical protein